MKKIDIPARPGGIIAFDYTKGLPIPKTSSIYDELDAPIPENEVSEREAYRGGPVLSYLTGAYVIHRLNQVLKQGNWDYRLIDLTKVFEGKIQQASGEVFTTSYIAKVGLSASIADKSVDFVEIGYGDGTDKKSAGKAHELAVKEAVTDALKRGAKNLGISMGLGLYFKDGKFVAASEPAPTPPPPLPKPTPAPPPTALAKPLRDALVGAFTVLSAQQKTTSDKFKAKYLSGRGLSAVPDGDIEAILGNVKSDFPELGL